MSVIEKLEGEAQSVVEAVEANVKAVEVKVLANVENILSVLSADEKLLLRNLELVNLRAHVDAARAAESISNTEKQFKQIIDGFVVKYSVPVTHAFNIMSQAFEKIEKAL